MSMNVAVTGAGSMIAGALRARADTAHWRYVGHAEALGSDAWLDGVDLVINCAFAPRLKTEPYDAALDADLSIARRIASRRSVRFVMLSSRMAYGPAGADPRLCEHRPGVPDRPYGIAKRTTELALQAVLGDRVTILRLSNVFGNEYLPGRANFFGIALRNLREHDRITLDISPFVERDFIPVEEVAEALVKVVHAPRAGLFNVGAGVAIPTGRIAQWLIEGYGRGSLLVTDMREFDAFVLDISAAREAFGIAPVPIERVRARCVAIGRQLIAMGQG